MSLRKRRNPDGFWTKGPRVNPGGLRWRPVRWKPFKGGSAESFGDVEASFVKPGGKTVISFMVLGGTVRGKHGPKTKMMRVTVDHPGGRVSEYEIEAKTAADLKQIAQELASASKASRKPMRRNPSHGLTPHYEPEVFPRAKYYDDIEIPKGFIAQHYGNDAAPLWIHPGKRLSLWVNAKRPRDREVSGKRFVLGVTNDDYEPDPEPILETNSMRELLWTIANHRPGL